MEEQCKREKASEQTFEFSKLRAPSTETLKEIKVRSRGQWKRVFDEENHTDLTITHSTKSTYGLKTSETDETTIVAKHNTREGISKGAKLNVKSIDIEFKANVEYSYERANTVRQVRGKEIQRSREETTTFTVPPKTRLVRWQYVADIIGNEYDFHHTLTTTDDAVPVDCEVTATVEHKREIVFGLTPVRIRHKDDGRYVTVVTRDRWPAATLGHSDRFHFVLCESGEGKESVKIRSLSTPCPGYEYLSASAFEWVYGALNKDFDDGRSLYWFLSKKPPLYDGDVVTFRNLNYENKYLCYRKKSKKSTDVYCRTRKEEQWVLEVV